MSNDIEVANSSGDTKGGKEQSHPKSCQCWLCSNQNDVEINQDLLKNFLQGRVAIFAGAGISTEAKDIVGHTFYDEIRAELDQNAIDLEFPDLVTAYCAQPNGRLIFIEKLNKRFLYIKSMPELYWLATRFHRALAPMSVIDTIITTNWDSFFEQECWATPFVFAEDTAFWGTTNRKLLKIHGTVENLGSIVASREDYEQCAERLSTGLLGSRLKTILSEKTVIFCGYSLRDFDFQEIMRFVQYEMRGFQRQAYVVTIDNSEEALQRYKEFNIIPLITDATYFMDLLRNEWEKQPYIVPSEMYEHCSLFLDVVKDAHIELPDQVSMFDSPSVIYSMFYQDGLIHSLQRIVLLYKSGAYSNRHMTGHTIEGYQELKKKAVRLRRYDDAAYIEGYVNGLYYSTLFKENPDDLPPLYFAFGHERVDEVDDLLKILCDAEKLHKPSRIKAEAIVGQYERTEGFVLDHKCRLFGL